MSRPLRSPLSYLPALLMALTTAAPAAPPTPALTGVWTMAPEDFKRRDPAPYTDEARKLVDAQRAAAAAGKVLADAQRKCLPNGTPTMMLTEFALEILETPGRVTIVSESSPLVRTVYLNRKGPSEGLEPMWNGYSVGQRQGATLVVHTTNFNDRTGPVGFGGTIRAASTTLNERFDLTPDGETMIVQTTMTDARYLTRPWTITRHYTRLPEDAELWEYACEVGAAGWSERFAGEQADATQRNNPRFPSIRKNR